MRKKITSPRARGTEVHNPISPKVVAMAKHLNETKGAFVKLTPRKDQDQKNRVIFTDGECSLEFDDGIVKCIGNPPKH